MTRLDDVLVLVPKFTPLEARMAVLASWESDEKLAATALRLEGRVTGPLCEYATTLATRTPLAAIPVVEGTRVRAAARIFEPCFWEPQHPFCYEVQLELHDDERLLDMRRIVCGIRHLAIEDGSLLLNGHETVVEGVRHGSQATVGELDAWHEVGCAAWLVSASDTLCERTDRWGPMVLDVLPPLTADARDHMIRMRSHPSVLMWVVPLGMMGSYWDEFTATVHAMDPWRLIGQVVAMDEPASSASRADLLFLPAGHRAIGSAELNKPYVVLGDAAANPDVSRFQNFTEQIDEFRRSLGSPPGLVGVIL